MKQLLAWIVELEEKVRSLELENREPRDQLEEVKRKGARQAEPFRRRDSRRIPEEQKKRPGRPKGIPASIAKSPTTSMNTLTLP